MKKELYAFAAGMCFACAVSTMVFMIAFFSLLTNNVRFDVFGNPYLTGNLARVASLMQNVLDTIRSILPSR